jgi:ketosteroid isomerase-like protein
LVSRENVEIVRSAFEAFNRGDLDAAVANAASDIEYLASGAIPGATGVYRGPEEFKRFAGWLREEFDDARIEVHDLVEADDQVLVSVTNRGRGKRSGAETSWRLWTLWVLLDGKIVRGQGFTSRDEALEAAGLQE